MKDLYTAAYHCLMEFDVEKKLQGAQQLQQDFLTGQLVRVDHQMPIAVVSAPGRPERPILVHHTKVKQRKLGSPAGRFALVHAVAHIEFNAINLALDAVYRFRTLPDAYYADWLQVAAEEAYHFALIRERLQALGGEYGDLTAHNGLWEQACKTDHDVLVRMALVPRVLEARGLDVTPAIIRRLREVGDEDTVAVLEIILRDEIGHVRMGSHWFHYCCAQRGLEPKATFRQLICEIMQSPVRGPLYTEGRLQAGFTADELEQLRLLEENWVEECQLSKHL